MQPCTDKDALVGMPALPAVLRWENRSRGRYYLVTARRNLWGDWEVWRAWGAIGSRLGGQLSEPAADEAAARAGVARVTARRQLRGYRLL
jgi:predicted DNA-binding WGR domain protein